MYQKLCLGCALTPLPRIWQMQLPPIAEPRPPPPPPEKLGKQWMADRLHQADQLLDWMADGSLRGGVRFLSRAHGEDTRATAQELLEKAVGSCRYEMDDNATGSPVLWAILLAQQAHALQYCAGDAPPAWEVTDHPERWCVRAMHALLSALQDQRVALERGSRAPRDTRTVGRGLGGAQQVRDLHPHPHPLAPHPRTSSPFPLALARSWPAAAARRRACARSAWTSSVMTMRSKPRWVAVPHGWG